MNNTILVRGGGEVYGGVATRMGVIPKNKVQPNFRKELDWLKTRCTECDNSLGQQGVCTTLRSPEKKIEEKFPNRKRKREGGKEERSEKEKEMEKSAERKLYVSKLGGPTAKMGKSAQVVKLNKKSKNVRKIQPKGSLEKKTFKGARKGGEKGDKVRKITAFF